MNVCYQFAASFIKISQEINNNNKNNNIWQYQLEIRYCFESSNENSHWDSSFEYPKHMFFTFGSEIRKLIFLTNLMKDSLLTNNISKYFKLICALATIWERRTCHYVI